MNFGTKHVKIKIYAGDHPPPHCHVERADGTVTRVTLPTFIILTGPPLSKGEREMIEDKLDELCDYFDQMNPKTH
ncbi:DUF4160 domain-containing protein [Chitinophaga sp. GbtcB8]|uniref:DUF4160 domain-containing protein n=1 Tax=Chitinophaga sp. GbtcB8 TaxID=2824753 RepID=UPI001C2F6B33